MCRHIVALAGLLSGEASAQTIAIREPVVPEKAGKEFHALRITDTPPRLDGKLDDEVWLRAEAIDDMVQNEPLNMAPPRDRMVVQMPTTGRRRVDAAVRGACGRRLVTL